MNVNCVIIHKNKSIEFTTKPVEEDKVKVNDSWQPSFTLKDFIPEKVSKRWWQFWKRGSGAQYLILVEDFIKAVIPDSGKFDEWWTMPEAQKHVAKQVAKSRDQQKPFSNWQVIGLMLVIMGSSIFTAIVTKGLIMGF